MTLNELLAQSHERYQAAGNQAMTISNEFAAELVASLRAKIESRDETVADTPADPRDLLILKLWDDMQQLRAATSFLNGGIRPVQRVAG